jgi:allantoin racemase
VDVALGGPLKRRSGAEINFDLGDQFRIGLVVLYQPRPKQEAAMNITMLVPFPDALDMTRFSKEEFRKYPDLTVVGTDDGLDELQSFSDLEYHIGHTLDKATEIEQKGDCDALIIGCFGDPGLMAVRQKTTMPVMGTGATAFSVAAMFGDKIGIVVPQRQFIHVTERMIYLYRYTDRVVGLETTEDDISDTVVTKPEEMVKSLAEACRKLVVDKDADVLIFGCIGFAWAVEAVRDIFKNEGIETPIIEPGATVYQAAKLAVELGLNHDRRPLM